MTPIPRTLLSALLLAASACTPHLPDPDISGIDQTQEVQIVFLLLVGEGHILACGEVAGVLPDQPLRQLSERRLRLGIRLGS